MNKIIFTAFLFFTVGISALSAQEKKWTIEDCINYAIANNIGLQRQRLQTETAEVNYLQARMGLLPTLNLGSDASFRSGRSISPANNLITFNQNLSNQYSVNSEINLFSGFTALNTITARKFMVKAGMEAEKIVRNTLIVDILGQYYQVIYATGLETAAKMQLELSESQLFRISRIVETGKEAVARKYEIESEVSADRLAYTSAQNSAEQAVTTLKQMLQLDPGTEFDILLPDLESALITNEDYNPDSIYQVASEVLPRLKAIDYELQAVQKQVAVAKGNLAPSLRAGGTISKGYYKEINDTIPQVPFAEQLKNNNSQALYLSLNIPIFNNYLNGRAIRLAKIQKSDTELRLLLEKNNLYTEVENACLDYNRGKDEYLAAESNLEFNRKSFYTIEKKFETGLVEVTDYSSAKTALFVAETEALRTKLQLLIRGLTIQFYTTGEYENIIFN